MITLSDIKSYLNIETDDTSDDTLITNLISKGYNYIESHLNIEIGVTGSVTENRYYNSDNNGIYLTFEVDSISSILDQDSNLITDYTIKNNYLTFSDDYIVYGMNDYINKIYTITYEMKKEDNLNDIIIDMIVYEFQRFRDNTIYFRKSRKDNIGLSESFIQPVEFYNMINSRLNSLVTKVI